MMKLRKDLSTEEFNVWQCSCGTYTPISKELPTPNCEMCRRKNEGMDVETEEV
jgi:hypothetical protein